jgi:hypothetical protein
MKVFYSLYKHTPLKQANRLSSFDPKEGVLIKGVLGNKTMFADYFPHQPLGDRSCDQFLSEFKFQDVEYDKKVFQLLLKDHEYQNVIKKTFTNHQLWSDGERLESNVIKYKLLRTQDKSFMICLEKGLKLRLDANAIFSRNEYEAFLKDIPKKYHESIEYIEDPLYEEEWKDLTLPCARDFIEGSPFSHYIYKPNCEFIPTTDAKIIYSSYLGHDIGRWHTYSELAREGDLTLTHGIVSKGFYQEEHNLFKGSYQDGFTPDEGSLKKLYKDISGRDWKLLCSM